MNCKELSHRENVLSDIEFPFEKGEPMQKPPPRVHTEILRQSTETSLRQDHGLASPMPVADSVESHRAARFEDLQRNDGGPCQRWHG